MFDRFTEQAKAALLCAESEAQHAGAESVDPVHLALACLGQEASDVVRLLSQLDVSPDVVASRLRVEPVDDPGRQHLPMSDLVKRDLVAAMRLAMDAGHTMVTSAHVLAGILVVDPYGEVGSVLRSLGADLDRITKDLALTVSDEFISPSQNPVEPA